MSDTPIVPNSRGVPSPSDVKASWDSMQPAGEAPVAAQMRKEGWRISARSVGRCRARGFAPTPTDCSPKARSAKAAKTSPEIDAINQVKAMAPESTPPDVMAQAMAEALARLPDGARDRVKALVEMDEQTLMNNTDKLVKVARYLLAEDLAQHTKLMMLAPDKAAKLFVALGTRMVPAPLPPTPPSDGVVTIDHNANEPRRLSSSAQAIEDFRAKRRSAAA